MSDGELFVLLVLTFLCLGGLDLLHDWRYRR